MNKIEGKYILQCVGWCICLFKVKISKVRYISMGTTLMWQVEDCRHGCLLLGTFDWQIIYQCYRVESGGCQ